MPSCAISIAIKNSGKDKWLRVVISWCTLFRWSLHSKALSLCKCDLKSRCSLRTAPEVCGFAICQLDEQDKLVSPSGPQLSLSASIAEISAASQGHGKDCECGCL